MNQWQACQVRNSDWVASRLPSVYAGYGRGPSALLATIQSVSRQILNNLGKRAGMACWMAAMLLLLTLCLAPAVAQTAPAAQLTELRAERAEDGLYLSAQMRFELSTAVEEALYKGIPVYFVAEVDIVRERWYWSDERVAEANRYMRLSYQPLTRRWRLSSSSEPLNDVGLGVNFGQYYESLAEAMAAVQRISQWKVAEASDLEGDARQTLRFRFQLDSSQLPRTFQLRALGQSDWDLSIERRLDLTRESPK